MLPQHQVHTLSQQPSHSFYVCLLSKGVTFQSTGNILVLSEAREPTTLLDTGWVLSNDFCIS